MALNWELKLFEINLEAAQSLGLGVLGAGPGVQGSGA